MQHYLQKLHSRFSGGSNRSLVLKRVKNLLSHIWSEEFLETACMEEQLMIDELHPPVGLDQEIDIFEIQKIECFLLNLS